MLEKASQRRKRASPDYSPYAAKSQQCVDRGKSLEERGHRDEQFHCRLRFSVQRSDFSQAFAPETRLGVRYKPQAHCLRSGGLAPRAWRTANDRASVNRPREIAPTKAPSPRPSRRGEYVALTELDRTLVLGLAQPLRR